MFSLNLATGLGFGLAIDYSLFVVSRYREELARGVSPPVAVGRSMQTAGRTVAFSAGTVAISLTALAIFPVPYLRSFAYAGVAVVALAAVSAVVVLPAVLAVLGPRVEKLPRVQGRARSTDGGFWGRQADRVMRHPVPYAVTVSLVLILLAIPFFHLNLGLSDDRVGPKDMSSRVATEQIPQELREPRGRRALGLRSRHRHRPPTASAIDRFARKLESLPGVARVDALTGEYLVIGKQGRRRAADPRAHTNGSYRRRGSAARTSPSCPTSSRCRAGRAARQGHPRHARAVRLHRRRPLGADSSTPRRPSSAGCRSRSGSSRSRPSCCCS